MLPNTDETTVDIVTQISSKQPAEVEEIRTGDTSAGKAQAKKQIVEKKEEPNPLLLDPYDFDRCAITKCTQPQG